MQPEFDAIGLPIAMPEAVYAGPDAVLDRRWHNYGRDIYAGTRDWLDANAVHVGVASSMELAEHIVRMHNSAVLGAATG